MGFTDTHYPGIKIPILRYSLELFVSYCNYQRQVSMLKRGLVTVSGF